MPPDDMLSNGVESPRPQPDPLPSKQGEIGYIEAVEPPTDILHSLHLQQPTTRPHSVDRNHSPISPDSVIPPAQSEVVTCPSSDQLSSTASITKPNGMLDFFKSQGPPAFGGLRPYTLVIFAVQLILLGGTVTAWVFASKCLAIAAEQNHQTLLGLPTTIPVYIIFILIIFVQLVHLERLLFRLRGERYAYVHRGEILPHHQNIPHRSSIDSTFAPWNHPSLPTYAAALSQSGIATGDVEDHIIAVSPPPAYDNTRGNIFAFSRFSWSSLRRESALSYVSRNERRGSHVQNLERVQRPEETADRLEPPSAAHIAR